MAAPRWPALDGLRGLAILLVLVAHSQLFPAVTAGMLGVTLFFVLSGFLITFLLLGEKEETGRIDLTAFYARRALRLLPALFIYLAGIAVLASVLELEVPIWDMTWPPALYVANYVQLAGNDLFAHRHTWSLAVEEHFYLIWPILIGLGVTRKLRALLMAVGVLLVWRLGAGMIDTVWAYQATDTNAYALGIGCVAAVLRHREFKFQLPRRTPELGVAYSWHWP